MQDEESQRGVPRMRMDEVGPIWIVQGMNIQEWLF